MLFIPINTIKFSEFKNIFQREKIANSVEVSDEPQVKFETEKTIIEVDEDINVKNDTFFSISKVLPYVWVTVTLSLLVYRCFSI